MWKGIIQSKVPIYATTFSWNSKMMVEDVFCRRGKKTTDKSGIDFGQAPKWIPIVTHIAGRP